MIKTYGQLVAHVAVRVGVSRDSDLCRIQEYCLDALQDYWRRQQWAERKRRVELTCTPHVEVQFTATMGSATITRTGGPVWDATLEGRKFSKGWSMAYYVVEKVVDQDTITLHRPYSEDDVTDEDGAIWVDWLELPDDVAEIIDDSVWVLYENGTRLPYLQDEEAEILVRSPSAPGLPSMFAPGERRPGSTGLYDLRTIRLLPLAPDKPYVVRLGYYNHYPPLDEVDPNSTPLYVPSERIHLIVWNALSTAYSEQPWLDQQQMERFEGKYERELDTALRAHKEQTADTGYLEGYDEHGRV